MTTSADQPPASGAQLAVVLGADVVGLDRELAEMLSSAESGEGADAWAQLVTLTRRSVLMEAQVDVLEGKRRALARHRDAIASLVDALDAIPATEGAVSDGGAGAAEAASASL